MNDRLLALSRQPQSAEERATQFVPVAGGDDATSAEALLVAAYLLMWAALMAFIFMTWRRQRRLEQKAAELSRRLDESARGG